MVRRRALLGGAAAAGVGGLTVAAIPPTAAHADVLTTPFTGVTVPHLVQAEQMAGYQRMLAAGHLPGGIVGYWPLDGNGGDRSGFARPVSAGTGTTWTSLRAGGELSLDGTTEAYASTGPVLDTTTPFTVSAWVRLAPAASLSRMYTAVSQDGVTSSRFLLQYDPGAGWAFKVRLSDGTGKVSAVATTPGQPGTWVHLAGVSDTSGIHLYVNGVLEGTADVAYNWAAPQAFNIGRGKYGGAAVNWWNGSIDDVRAYNRALTAAEIAVVSSRTARQNNVYLRDAPASVVWGPPADLTGWVARARCASFITAVLKRSCTWATDSYFQTYFADPSPEAADYRIGFDNDPGPRLKRIRGVAELQPGDLIAVDYNGSGPDNTGHVVMVRQLKGVYSGSMNFTGETQYAVEVVDCTSDPHGVYGLPTYPLYPDTRMVDDLNNFQGVGLGHMMCYASDATGEFSRYRWSVNTGSAGTHTVSERPVSAARVV